MKQNQFDTLVQLAVGIVAIAVMALFVIRGELEAAAIVPILATVLSAFGFAEVGRRQERKRQR